MPWHCNIATPSDQWNLNGFQFFLTVCRVQELCCMYCRHISDIYRIAAKLSDICIMQGPLTHIRNIIASYDYPYRMHITEETIDFHISIHKCHFVTQKIMYSCLKQTSYMVVIIQYMYIVHMSAFSDPVRSIYVLCIRNCNTIYTLRINVHTLYRFCKQLYSRVL